MKTIAIYHKDCVDGTTAAAVVLKKYPDAKLYPLGHSFEAHELAPIIESAEKGDRILTVDCVIGAKEFLAKELDVLSIDHHVGIEKECEALAAKDPRFTYIFDNLKSGASLTWSYLFSGETMPELIKYVEDSDIWTWKYGIESRHISNAVYLLVNKPEEVLRLLSSPIGPIMDKGRAITEYTTAMIDMAVEKTEPIHLLIGETRVPFYNITVLKSESGNRLSEVHKGAVALFSIDGSKVKISFRSIDGQSPTALDLAQRVGGGGHKNAAGAGMSLNSFLKAIVK